VARFPGGLVGVAGRALSLRRACGTATGPRPSKTQGVPPQCCEDANVPAEIYHHTLANGMTLLAERMEHVGSAALNFLVPAGCVYDPPDRPGVASILSDLIIRGAGERDSRELMLALDNLGLDRDATVGSMQTAFVGAA